MIPPAIKRPFLYPVPEDALAYFVHPDPRHPFHTPFHHLEDGNLYAGSAVAIRFRPSRCIAPDEYPGPSEEALRRFMALPWDRFPYAATQAKAWRCLDDHRGTIYADPLHDVWHRTPEGLAIDRTSKNVRICGAPIVPLAVLQLLARLPRIELYTGGCTLTGPILFRFSGGEGIIPHYGIETAAFQMLIPRDPLLPGALLQ